MTEVCVCQKIVAPRVDMTEVRFCRRMIASCVDIIEERVCRRMIAPCVDIIEECVRLGMIAPRQRCDQCVGRQVNVKEVCLRRRESDLWYTND